MPGGWRVAEGPSFALTRTQCSFAWSPPAGGRCFISITRSSSLLLSLFPSSFSFFSSSAGPLLASALVIYAIAASGWVLPPCKASAFFSDSPSSAGRVSLAGRGRPTMDVLPHSTGWFEAASWRLAATA